MTKHKKKAKWNPLDIQSIGKSGIVPSKSSKLPPLPKPLPPPPTEDPSSPTASRTLGEEDSDSVASTPSMLAAPLSCPEPNSVAVPSAVEASDSSAETEQSAGSPVQGNPLVTPNDKGHKPLFSSLFKDNRKITADRKLNVFQGIEDGFELDLEDVYDINKDWGFCLLGYVAGRFPGWKALVATANLWKVQYKLILHNSGCLVFNFQTDEDRRKVVDGGPYFVLGRSLLLKELPPFFEFKEEDISIVPLWIQLPRLPLECWHPRALGKIASRIGKPVSMDALTHNKERVSYARLLVEVDVSKELVKNVHFKMPNGKVRVQDVKYEFVPKFCGQCRCFGHLHGSCPSGTVTPPLETVVASDKDKGNGQPGVPPVTGKPVPPPKRLSAAPLPPVQGASCLPAADMDLPQPPLHQVDEQSRRPRLSSSCAHSQGDHSSASSNSADHPDHLASLPQPTGAPRPTVTKSLSTKNAGKNKAMEPLDPSSKDKQVLGGACPSQTP